MSNRERGDIRRRRLAYDAARIMVERGDGGFERARRKAAERAGVGDRRLWPSNEEIQDALREQQRLFQGERQASELSRLREDALRAMRRFSRFSPRLVGPVLDGFADARQAVRLLLFSDQEEDVIFTLMDQRIPWRQREETLRFSGGSRQVHSVLTFWAGETGFELVVLPPNAMRNPPLDPVSERPQRGADADDVERMLRETCQDTGDGLVGSA
jgi:hypothetical protein